jgi:hypothetical protein
MNDPRQAGCNRLLQQLQGKQAAPGGAAPHKGVRGQLVVAALTLALSACAAYQPPSGRGYDYDRGQAMARSDTGSDRLVYYVTGYAAHSLVALSQRIEANCGFAVRPAYRGAEPDRRELEFAQGYNSVSVPVIERRLGAAIGDLMQRCASGPGDG